MTSNTHFEMIEFSKGNSNCESDPSIEKLSEISLNEDQKLDESSLSWAKVCYSSLEESKAQNSDSDSEFNMDSKRNVEIKPERVSDFIKSKRTERTLEINGKRPQEVGIDLVNLNAIKKLIIDLTDFTFIEDQTKQLAITMKQLRNVKKAEVTIRNKTEGSAIQQQLDEIFSKLQEGLKEVKLDFYRSGVAAQCVGYLSENIIPKLGGLKGFHINLYDSNITNENLQKLAWNFKEKFEQLQDFTCNLAQTKVTEKMIVQLFHEMPKMKNFELNIGNCVFTDYGMKIFIRNTLKSMKVLEKFTFLVEATDFMSAQLIELFKNLPETIQKLRLDLRWTRTTSESLRVFMNEKLPKLTALEEAELKVDCTLASKKMKETIDGVNRKFARKIDAEECLKYQQMIKEKYSM